MLSIEQDSTARRGELRRAIDGAAARMITLVRRAEDLETRVPDAPEWTIRQLLAHVVTVVPRYTAGARQTGSWVESAHDLPDMNRDEIQRFEADNPESLLANLRAALDELFAVVDDFGASAPEFRFHGGAPIAADTALGILLGEFEVHGRDMARALGHPWRIDVAHARLILKGLWPILPGWVKPESVRGHTATYEIRVRGEGTYPLLIFRNGRLDVTSEPSRPDVVLSVDPVAFLLVSYRRQAQWGAILRGRMLAWGRRPWLAFSFVDRFYTP